MTGEKRPSSDMVKKPKPQKKKKKKDPNEPQKPVSAYALFFRDTQAAIKGQNPNATFGDVSKIVASMWDTLGEEQKQVRNYFCCLGKINGIQLLSCHTPKQHPKPQNMRLACVTFSRPSCQVDLEKTHTKGDLFIALIQ